ncbi:MAG: DUF6046 domain-containing protein [Bacteroidetes bacterium]|nr:DUF6046 domain-containing protein [Bacteroidota bacterium]
MNVSVINILNKVFGAKGIAFPQKVTTTQPIDTAAGFSYNGSPYNDVNKNQTAIRKYTDRQLGKYEFMPVEIDGIAIPNALIMITGEKEIIETNVAGALDSDGNIVGGTVFEKSFVKPYDLTVIATLIGDGAMNYPEDEMWRLTDLWKKNDVVTLKCALTDYFLETSNNALITKISVLDNAGAENIEVLQFDLRSNIDFELQIK